MSDPSGKTPMQMTVQRRYTDISRAFRQAPWRVQTQVIATLATAAVVIAALGGMYLAEASRAATAGRDVQSLQAQKSELLLAIDRHQVEIGRAKSLPGLESRARELGFVPAEPDQIDYLVVHGYPGSEPPATAEPEEIDVPDYDESLGTWLARTLSSLIGPGG